MTVKTSAPAAKIEELLNRRSVNGRYRLAVMSSEVETSLNLASVSEKKQ